MKTIFTTTAFIALLASVVDGQSAPIPTWSGPTEYACDGRCSQDWAETQLTDEERAELAFAKARRPEPSLVEVNPGDLFGLQTFYRDDEPMSSRTLTVAAIYDTAWGWRMDGWSWVKLDACQNWTKVLHTPMASEAIYDPREWANASTTFTAVTASISGPDPWVGPKRWPREIFVFDPEPTFDPIKPKPVPPAPVPLPAAAWLMLAGIGALVAVKKGRK
jgi:hypothetical protein